jgi:glutathione S-transferase
MQILPILYGMPASLYTAKVRSYLKKQGIAFEERPAGDPRFMTEILPQIGRWIIPVVQLPDGTLLQDGAVIIDHFEAQEMGHGPRALPENPLLAVLAHLFELFGGEGLLRSAMHYRWNFDAENLDFLRADFGSTLAPGAPIAQQNEVFQFASKRMRDATVAFGVNSTTISEVEASTIEFLQRFDRHLANTPYLLGSTPTYADYGLIAPFFALLGRDPLPSLLMKKVAPRVWRWVERMNAPDADTGEYLGKARDWLNPMDNAQTLEAMLQFVAEDYLPEIVAHVEFANSWLAKRPDLAAGTNGHPKPGERAIGITQVQWRGHSMDVLVMPYRIFMLQRVQDAAQRLNTEQDRQLRDLFSRTGLSEVLKLRCRRRVLRQGHFEVWGPDADASPQGFTL